MYYFFFIYFNILQYNSFSFQGYNHVLDLKKKVKQK